MTEKKERGNPYAEQELRDRRAGATAWKILSRLFIALTVLCLALNQTVPAVVCGILAGITEYCRDRSEKKIKECVSSNFVRDAVLEVFPGAEYVPFGHVSDGKVGASGMVFPFGAYNTVEGSDYIHGTYHGVEVELSDVELLDVELVRDEEMNTESDTRRLLFKGQWLICHLKKELSGCVRVSAKTRDLRWREKQGDGIEMENDAFNQRFFVTADDPHTAFYVLTPHRMEYILAAAGKSGGDLYLSFQRDGTVHIAVNSGRDFFELGRSKVDSAQLRRKFLEEMHWFGEMIDELKIEEAR